MAAAMFDRLEGFEDTQGRDLRPALAIATGLIATALAWNAWLLRMGYGPLTSLASTPQGRRLRRHFDDHCDGLLLVDLFNLGGHAVTHLHRRHP